MELVTIMRTVA